VPALAAGFPPDSISTDLHLSSLNGAALDTLHTVSKCIAMGMPLAEAIERTTVTPARAIRRPELGTLSEGARPTWRSCAGSTARAATPTAAAPGWTGRASSAAR